MLKFVTVLVAGIDGDDDGNCESGSRFIASEEDQEEMIQEARDEAIERYEENIGSIPVRHRIVVHEVEFPTPKPQHTVVKATLPDVDLPEQPITASIG